MHNPWTNFAGKRVLLLQGPVGPFFRQLSRELTEAGAEVHKVNFNGGDWAFYPTHAINYRGSLAEWPERLAWLLERLEIDVVLLFGDCRPIHRVAIEVAQRLRVQIGAFEEGYIWSARPPSIARCLPGAPSPSSRSATRSGTRPCGRSSTTSPPTRCTGCSRATSTTAR